MTRAEAERENERRKKMAGMKSPNVEKEERQRMGRESIVYSMRGQTGFTVPSEVLMLYNE